MALAWNAGWVNSPRGFKSRILRSGPRAARQRERGLAALGLNRNIPVEEGYGTRLGGGQPRGGLAGRRRAVRRLRAAPPVGADRFAAPDGRHGGDQRARSEEHTSELQSRGHLV